MISRIAGLVIRPRATLADLVRQPRWLATWLSILIIWAVCAGWLLGTDIGRQAVVDERVRVLETFGRTVSDAEYAALQAAPPWWVYFTSGGRVLLAPPVTLVVGWLLWVIARADRQSATVAAITLSQTLTVVVYASVALLIGQLVATPIHYVRESLTSPLNLAAVLPLMEEGTLPSRFFGTLDVFALWWATLLAVGLSVLTGRPVTRYVWPVLGVFFGFAAVVAAVIAATGGA